MEMDNTKYCQSCAMPMGETDEFYGTNSDGSKSEDYCSYCFENGEFISGDVSMNDMIEACIAPMVSSNQGMTEDVARKIMNEAFPNLKRWKSN